MRPREEGTFSDGACVIFTFSRIGLFEILPTFFLFSPPSEEDPLRCSRFSEIVILEEYVRFRGCVACSHFFPKFAKPGKACMYK